MLFTYPLIYEHAVFRAIMTYSCQTYHLEPFWDHEFKNLDYKMLPFNDPEQIAQWVTQGFGPKFTGEMCDMRSTQPSWNHRILDYFQHKGWQDIGTSYYRMTPGTVLPQHHDRYVLYARRFQLEQRLEKIRRAVIMLEDWQPGHYLDCNGTAFVHWQAGDVVEWTFDTPHSAANIGMTDRYTLQVTGWVA